MWDPRQEPPDMLKPEIALTGLCLYFDTNTVPKESWEKKTIGPHFHATCLGCQHLFTPRCELAGWLSLDFDLGTRR